MFSKILEYNIFNLSKIELINLITGDNKIVHIISGNPEVLFAGRNNKTLDINFNSNKSLIIPDGIGTVIASKIVRQPVKEKIAGIDIMEELIRYADESGRGIYLLGAEQEVLLECTKNINKRYPKVNICGSHNGFFDVDDCKDILEDISKKRPYILFVAMGCPRQELFISKYMDMLPCSIFMGVGGSFDVYAGKVKRAPKWMIKIGLEWLYRVAKEPWRIKRLSSIPKFLLKVIYNNYVVKDKI